jgi:hypothetical protein
MIKINQFNKKLFNDAYDSAYNLKSKENFNFIDDYMTELEEIVETQGYKFKIVRNKFKMVMLK